MRPAQPLLQEERNPKTASKGSFFRSIARNVHSGKLGDLLVLGALISPAQLEAALSEQKQTGDALGRILIRQKAVSAVHIYRKLAEQWCLRASTAGLTLLMQTIPTGVAQADLTVTPVSLTPQFTLAAAIVPGRHLPPRHPGLFGTQEVRSDDITPFRKWTDVMHRFEMQMKTVSVTAPRFMMWKAEIQRLRGRSQQEQLAGVNTFLNQVPYVEDIDNYGQTDYWATPLEFLTNGGDCEDFAIAKYASLRALGFSTDQLRIAIVQDKVKNMPHAILIVYADDGAYVLDNQNKKVEPASLVTRYKPIFSINSTSWWLHRA